MALERRDRILRRENRSLPFFSVWMIVLLQNKIHEVFKGDKHARIEIVGGKVPVVQHLVVQQHKGRLLCPFAGISGAEAAGSGLLRHRLQQL